jgi:transposase
MTNLSSLAKTILLNHIRSFQSYNIKNGRPRIFSYMLDRILFLLSTGCQWSKLPLSHGSWKTVQNVR